MLIRQRVSFRFPAPPTSLLHAFPARAFAASFGRLFRTMATSHLVSPRSCAQRRKNRCPLSSRCSRIRWHQGKSPPGQKKRVRSARRDRRDPFPHPPPKCACNAENSLVSGSAGKRRAACAHRVARALGNLAKTAYLTHTTPTLPIAEIETTSKRSHWAVGLTGSAS